MSSTEAFELSLHGGAIEKRYRRQCPRPTAIDWTSFDASAFERAALEHARASWTRSARQEFESTLAHAEVVARMVRARMPLDLIALGTRYQVEELSHAELAGRVAMVLGGGAAVPQMPPRAIRPSGARPLYELLELALPMMCIGETYSHAVLQEGWKRAQDPMFRDVRSVFAKEEAAHGRYGWTILEMILPEIDAKSRAELRTLATTTLARRWAPAEKVHGREHFGELSPIGNLEPEEYREVALGALDRIRARLSEHDLV
jgi:hypothetical protein